MNIDEGTPKLISGSNSLTAKNSFSNTRQVFNNSVTANQLQGSSNNKGTFYYNMQDADQPTPKYAQAKDRYGATQQVYKISNIKELNLNK